VLVERLREFHRILKPGGRFVNLETSQPSSRLIRRIYHLYVRLTVKRLGSRISGSKAGYAYLAQTIPRFYNAGELAEIIRQAGFSRVSIHSMLFGAAAIHKAVK
jgi:demethylmenaquinone methyltransferase/2-methoxy-6-polyprenyl-1,4-benzoquinol methylase